MNDKPVERIIWKSQWKETGPQSPPVRAVIGETGNGSFRPGFQALHEEHGRGVSFQGISTEWHEQTYPKEVQARYHAWGSVNRILEQGKVPESPARERARAALQEMTQPGNDIPVMPEKGRGPER